MPKLAGIRAWIFLPSLAAGLAGSVGAQPLPSAGSILRQQEQSLPRRAEQLPGAISPQPVRAPLRDAAGLNITLRSVRFSGAQGLASAQELDALVQDSLGKPMDSAGLQALADRVTQLLKSKGWFLARAYLPQQDLTDGQLEIAILAGRLDGGLAGIVLRADALRLGEDRVRAIVGTALGDGGELGLHVGHLERALLLLNELPGISAQSSLERGQDADSTRLTLILSEGPVTSGSATIDNFGSRYTGAIRATGSARWNDPLRIGDALSFNGVAAEGITLGALSYSRPLGSQGLGLTLNASSLRYRVGAELASLGLSGTAQTTGVSLAYPLILSSRTNLRATLGSDLKRLADNSSATNLRERRITSLNASLAGDLADTWQGGGFSNYSLSLVQGRVDLSRNAADLAADQLGPQTQGRYAKLNYALARLQKLPGNFTAFASLNGQLAARNLDSSEKFVLGGNVGVRAYPAGEGAGDAGWLASLELRYDLADLTRLGKLQAYTFYDTGSVRLNKTVWGAGAVTNATNSNEYRLSGAGLGVVLNRAAAYSLRAFWAATLGDNPGRSVSGNFSDGRASRSRVMMTANLSF